MAMCKRHRPIIFVTCAPFPSFIWTMEINYDFIIVVIKIVKYIFSVRFPDLHRTFLREVSSGQWPKARHGALLSQSHSLIARSGKFVRNTEVTLSHLPHWYRKDRFWVLPSPTNWNFALKSAKINRACHTNDTRVYKSNCRFTIMVRFNKKIKIGFRYEMTSYILSFKQLKRQ